MATIILNQNETSTIANDGDIVRGRQGGAETILIGEGVTDIETNAELERVDLAFSSTDLTFQVTENGLEISDGTNTIVTIPSLNQDLDLRFTDGNVTLSQTGAQEFTVANPTDAEDTAIIGTEATALTVGLGEDVSEVDQGVTPPGVIEGDADDNLITPDSEDFPTTDGDDDIRGLAGNDTIDGGAGVDTVDGGAGNDVLIGDPDDAALDGGEGFDILQTGAVGDSIFGGNSDDISLQPVSNVQALDTTNSEGGNNFDLSDLLVESITGGENTLGVLENSLAILVGEEVDEIDLGDITPPSAGFQPGDEPPITIQIVRTAGVDPDITNPGSARFKLLDFGVSSVIGEGEFTVLPESSYYLGTEGDDTVTAAFADLDVDSNGLGNDTIAAADGNDTLALTGSVPGELPIAPFGFFSGFEALDLTGVTDGTVSGTLVLDNDLVGQLVRGQPEVDEADTLTVITTPESINTINTQDVGQDDEIILEGGSYVLADEATQATLLQGNIVSISDNGAGIITGGNGNDSITGGAAGDYVDLRPKPGNTSSGDNVVTGGAGDDTIAGGNSQDSLGGGAGNDRFLFELDSITSGVSRLDANDTVAGGEGEADTVALVANTQIRGTSELNNVTGVEVIELNADGDDDNDQFFPLLDLLDNDDDAPGDGFPDTVNNTITLIDSVVESADGGLTIDASNGADDNRDQVDRPGEGAVERPGEVEGFFSLSDPNEVLGTLEITPSSPADSVDNNRIDLSELSEDVAVTIEGGNAHEQVIFSDVSFNGQHEIDGGDGGVDPTARAVGLPTPNAATPVTPTLASPPTSNANRIALADGISNFDTLDFRADGSDTFSANITDFNNIGGFEEIQLSNEIDNANSSFDIEIDDDVVRQLTQNVGADTTSTGQNTNLTLSLDTIDAFVDTTSGAGATTNLNRDLGPNTDINLVTEALTDSLNTLTVLDPNGLSLPGTAGSITISNPSRVNVQIADIITSAEIAEARGRVISQSYAPPAGTTVTVTAGHNLLGLGDDDATDFDEEGVSAKLDFGAGPTAAASTGNINISTGDGDFVIWGSTNNDTITAGNGNDSLVGGPGNDVFNRLGGAEGADTINGGAGADTLLFNNFDLGEATGVEVNLDESFATGVDSIEDDANESSIENITGSTGDDTLTGSDEANVINGAAGDDTIVGLAGADSLIGGADDDTLEGGAGADTLTGGNGTDTASYATSPAAVTVILQANTFAGGDATGDEATGIENLIGSAFADNLVGDGNANQIEGGDGQDTINGLAGGDSLLGGDDNDTIIGGPGADTIDGGAGIDTVSYATAAAAVTVDLSLEAESPQGDPGTDANGDVLIEIQNIVGSGLDDRLTGDEGENLLQGAVGLDTLTGGDGSDIFFYDAITEGGVGEQITDFDPVNDGDTIQLNSNFDFGGAPVGSNVFNAGENGNVDTALVVNGGLEAFINGGGTSLGLGSALPTYIYGAQSGILAYDPDGDGGAAAQAITEFENPIVEPADGQTFNEALAETVFEAVQFVDVV
ncbi:MAG: hypothetical protein GVY17_03305 [Cyanobacteria bacterium]|jgi:Ca2+-binding RTX toxin-like protein|nr:hypothetical protein [Cyanobacteria bacterium GSL.Bin21]